MVLVLHRPRGARGGEAVSTETKHVEYSRVAIVCDGCHARYNGRRGWFRSAHTAAQEAATKGWRIGELPPMTDLLKGTFDICPRCAEKVTRQP